MKIEKLNEDKIRITLNLDDLKKKDIDFHSFMSNSIESQEMFLDMLDKAEEEVGFKTEDYQIMVEALAMSDGNFILTVTRILPDKTFSTKKNLKLKARRKTPSLNVEKAIYEFENFDDFCTFSKNLNSCVKEKIKNLAKINSLYLYNNTYYLILTNINKKFKYLNLFSTSIAEFAHFTNNSNLFEHKIKEYGKEIIEKKAIETVIKYF